MGRVIKQVSAIVRITRPDETLFLEGKAKRGKNESHMFLLYRCKEFGGCLPLL